MYLTGNGSIPTLDLIAYTGYKYVGYEGGVFFLLAFPKSDCLVAT